MTQKSAIHPNGIRITEKDFITSDKTVDRFYCYRCFDETLSAIKRWQIIDHVPEGFFINTAQLRYIFHNSATFPSLIKRICTKCNFTILGQGYPLNKSKFKVTHLSLNSSDYKVGINVVDIEAYNYHDGVVLAAKELFNLILDPFSPEHFNDRGYYINKVNDDTPKETVINGNVFQVPVKEVSFRLPVDNGLISLQHIRRYNESI